MYNCGFTVKFMSLAGGCYRPDRVGLIKITHWTMVTFCRALHSIVMPALNMKYKQTFGACIYKLHKQ